MFDTNTRTMMAAMFSGGIVTEIAGVFSDRLGDDHRWEIRYYPEGRYNPEAYYTGTVSTYYDMYEADTLDEVLDLMEAWVAPTLKEAVTA